MSLSKWLHIWLFTPAFSCEALTSKWLFIAVFHMFACSFSDILDISIGLVTAGNQLNIHMKTLTTTLNIHVASTTMPNGCWNPDGNEVLNIRLSGMMLRGQFPRGIKNCTRFTGLDLLANELSVSGPLSFDMAELVPFILKLDLSRNKFSGKIPMSFSNCSYLNVLRLDHNQLTGEIPPELGLLNCIKVFSVSNNSLRVLFPFSLSMYLVLWQ